MFIWNNADSKSHAHDQSPEGNKLVENLNTFGKHFKAAFFWKTLSSKPMYTE